MTLKLISSQEVVFTGEASSVALPGTLGRFMVLENHAALISTLTEGDIIYVGADGKETAVCISGGIVDVNNNVVSVCIY